MKFFGKVVDIQEQRAINVAGDFQIGKAVQDLLPVLRVADFRVEREPVLMDLRRPGLKFVDLFDKVIRVFRFELALNPLALNRGDDRSVVFVKMQDIDALLVQIAKAHRPFDIGQNETQMRFDKVGELITYHMPERFSDISDWHARYSTTEKTSPVLRFFTMATRVPSQ